MAMPVQRPHARSDDLVIEEVDDELLVYDSTNKRGHCLGATAARVWRACDGHSDVSAISEALELDAEVVRQALDELEALELLDTQGVKVVQAGSGNGDGLTRRQLAGRSARVGAGIAAAPLVYSISVSPAMALMTPTPFQCQLYTVQSCGTSSACGKLDGCCCCCQGGGSCKTCGATAFCNSTPPTQPCNPTQGGGFGTNCSTEGEDPIDERGCCGVTGAMMCGCGFGPRGNCCNQNTGVTCTPNAGNADCFPCCNGVPLTPAATLGCCKSSSQNCCVAGAPACCDLSSQTVDCCTNPHTACCLTDTCGP